MTPFPAQLGATTKTMRLGPGVPRVGTFRSGIAVVTEAPTAQEPLFGAIFQHIPQTLASWGGGFSFRTHS